jgi:SNF2 family DNA or RNA helicase
MVIGKDFAFWSQSMRFAGSLVARQRFLPGLDLRDKGFCAIWEPVVTGEDKEILSYLAKAMPPSARALTDAMEASPPETPPDEVLTSFVGRMVDHLVRFAGKKDVPQATGKKRGQRKAASFDSLHDQWLYALQAEYGSMEGPEAELARLSSQIHEWRRPVAVSISSPVRLCFRLEEPEDQANIKSKGRAGSNNSWYVRYLLQPADDLSLLIAVEKAWGRKGTRLSILNRPGFNLHEYLFSSLGQAACLCPRIERSLKTSKPGGYELDSTGAHEFLTQKGMALEQAGFGVMLPAWWTRKGTKLRLSLRANVKSPAMQGSSGLSLNEIVQFDWEVALGDEKLSIEELESLARLKSPLVKVRGQWVEMSAEEIQTALEFWKKKAADTTTVKKVIHMALGGTENIHGIVFSGVSATGWIGDLLDQLEGSGKFREIPPSEKFSGTLRPYQIRGYSWLTFLRQWGLGACLADDMGLGKTVQTLALIQRDWKVNGKCPVLLVCPTSVVTNWQKEAGRFTPDLPVMIHHGQERKKGKIFRKEAERHAMVVSTYALLHRDIEHLREVEWAGVVLDEAQNIKNPETKQAKAARSLKADYRVSLTGTPVENTVGDLWSIMEFLNPGLLGTQAGFKRKFFIPIQAGHDPEAASRLKRITAPFILRRLKTDKSIIADLPEKLEMKVFCPLTREQATLYKAVLREVEESLDSSSGIMRKGIILATLSKLKQVCNHPLQFLGDNSSIQGRSGKLARLTEMLEEILEVGEKALIFSQFSAMGYILKQHIQESFGREVLFLHGSVPKRLRDQMVERFQKEDSSLPIFVLSLKAGGTGLNLTSANHVFHFDRWWNPAVENQATDRAFRIGQRKNVEVHKFICAGTLEEKIDEMIENKKEIAEKVVGTGEGWLTELSDKEIKEIFVLREEEAIGE